jgi:hypothetical protein
VAIVTIGEICTAVHTVMEELVTSGELARVQNYDELTEGMNTTPTLQVYPERWEVDVASDTDRTTFVDTSTGIPGVRQTEVALRLDLYVRQRSQLNEDWGNAIDLASTVSDKLDEEGNCPLFAQTGIRSMHWTCTRVVFDYATVLYTGFRFDLTVRIF